MQEDQVSVMANSDSYCLRSFLYDLRMAETLASSLTANTFIVIVAWIFFCRRNSSHIHIVVGEEGISKSRRNAQENYSSRNYAKLFLAAFLLRWRGSNTATLPNHSPELVIPLSVLRHYDRLSSRNLLYLRIELLELHT